MTASIHSGRFGHRSDSEVERTDDDRERTQRAHHEQFPFTYLPDPVRDSFEEALECYSADLFNAFALMCRRTLTVSGRTRDEAETQRSKDAVIEILRIGDVDDASAESVEQLLFGNESEIPPTDAAGAAILLEVMKDVLYQIHVRGARFQAALRVRSFFAAEHENKLTTLRLPRGAKFRD